MEDAETGFAQVLVGGTGPSPDLHASTFLTLARVQQARGKLSAALQTCQEGLRFATRGGQFLPFYAGEAHLGIAQVLCARNQLNDAHQHAIVDTVKKHISHIFDKLGAANRTEATARARELGLLR
jgi:ATP/maltotriose-dependent transcriptional regulator MalT